MEGFYSATGEFIKNNIDFFYNTGNATTKTTPSKTAAATTKTTPSNKTAAATTKTTPSNSTGNATTKTTPSNKIAAATTKTTPSNKTANASTKLPHMDNNMILKVGHVLVSPDEKTTFGLDSDGNIYKTVNGIKKWCSSFWLEHTLAYTPAYFIFKNNTIIVYDDKNEEIWTLSSQTNETDKTGSLSTDKTGSLSVDNDTNVYIKVGNQIVWETGKYNSLITNVSPSDARLNVNEVLVSSDGTTTFGLHSDGNIYVTVNGIKQWCSSFFGGHTLDYKPAYLLLTDTICIYDTNDREIWKADIKKEPGTTHPIFLYVGSGGFALYDVKSKFVWGNGILSDINMNILTFRQKSTMNSKSNNLVYILDKSLGQIAIPYNNIEARIGNKLIYEQD